MSSFGNIPESELTELRMHLARLRHERGLSYDQLAAISGVGRSTLVTLESGKPRRNPNRPETTGTLITWYRLAAALNVTLDELLSPLNPTPRRENSSS